MIRGFDRPNLHFEVRRFSDATGKEEALVRAVAEAPKPGIVYIATRKASEELAAALAAAGVKAEAYHAGLRRSAAASCRTASWTTRST